MKNGRKKLVRCKQILVVAALMLGLAMVFAPHSAHAAANNSQMTANVASHVTVNDPPPYPYPYPPHYPPYPFPPHYPPYPFPPHYPPYPFPPHYPSYPYPPEYPPAYPPVYPPVYPFPPHYPPFPPHFPPYTHASGHTEVGITISGR